jgi:acetoin utilization deacetylase AcuC-like enzyme
VIAHRPIWLLTDAAMDAHHAPGHPERPERRLAVASGVRDAAGDALVEPPCREVTDEELARVHDARYLELLDALDRQGTAWLDPDTYLVPGSMHAARLAAGATIQAALGVAAGEATVAVAAVRPPGHHAAAGRGAGFCLYNNVALAAAALRAEGLAQRIAIVDWDVHHGDGTQAIFDADPDLCYTSTHQAPFYPGTGDASERGHGHAVGTKHNVPLRPGDGDDRFVAAWTETLLPAVEAFAPQAILLSAGFDAHRSDPLAHLEVSEVGYGRVARALGQLAARLGLPGVALTLEGGYDLPALRASVAETVRELIGGLGAPS